MSFGDDALSAAILKALADAVGTELSGTKTGLVEDMQAAGVEKVAARLPDGTKVASLPLMGGEDVPKVTDPAALLAWVRANHPGEIVESVRESYVEAVLAAAKKAGRALDRETGDVIPGITFEPTTPFVKVEFTTGDLGGRDLIRRAHQRGELDMLAPALALPAGGES
jgi:hypothetical protein